MNMQTSLQTQLAKGQRKSLKVTNFSRKVTEEVLKGPYFSRSLPGKFPGNDREKLLKAFFSGLARGGCRTDFVGTPARCRCTSLSLRYRCTRLCFVRAPKNSLIELIVIERLRLLSGIEFAFRHL